jgi:hypothetical protein
MKRREFIALLGGAAIIWPLGTSAQQHIRRVAVLSVGVAPQSRDFALAHELAKLGYIEGNNITYDIRGAEGDSSRLPQLALELVAKKPEVIVGSTSTVAVVLANATREIPIVMMVVGDPIALGLSNSMSHPSRNVTGFTMSTTALAAKRLELLRELVPGIRKVAFLRTIFWSHPSPYSSLRSTAFPRSVFKFWVRLALLKSEPRQREVDARNHRSCGNHPQPSQPSPLRPAFGQECDAKSEYQSSDCCRRCPTVPVDRDGNEPNGGVDDIFGMVCPQKDDAERGIHGKQRQISRQCDYVENRECCPVCECEPAECGSRHHDPKPLMLFTT